MEQQKKSKFLKGALIIGIVIVLNLFFNYALSLIYPAPDYNTFCPTSQVINQVATQNDCVAQGGQWNGNVAQPVAAPGVKSALPAGYCNLSYTCDASFQKANDAYSRNVFIILVVLGAITLSVGVFFFANNPVLSTALSYAGVLSFLIASIRYWSSADNLIKVIILALALALLIAVAVKKFKE
jgi:hypothetical protein